MPFWDLKIALREAVKYYKYGFSMVVFLHMNTCVLTSAISESSGELDMVRSQRQAAQYSRSALYREAEKSQHQPGTSLQHQSQHWRALASALFSRAVSEGSRSFHNHGEGPPVLVLLYTRSLRHRSTIARWSTGDKQQIAAIQPDLE